MTLVTWASCFAHIQYPAFSWHSAVADLLHFESPMHDFVWSNAHGGIAGIFFFVAFTNFCWSTSHFCWLIPAKFCWSHFFTNFHQLCPFLLVWFLLVARSAPHSRGSAPWFQADPPKSAGQWLRGRALAVQQFQCWFNWFLVKWHYQSTYHSFVSYQWHYQSTYQTIFHALINSL